MTLQLTSGDDHVTIDPTAGGRLVSAVLGGAERLVTAPPVGVAPGVATLQWGSFVMAPWAGRVAHGALAWDGTHHRLDTLDGDGHALHGTVVHAEWEVVDAGDRVAELGVDLTGRGWPFGGRVHHRVELADGTLRCQLTVTAGTASMPVWVGWHPCLRRPATGDMRVHLDAGEVLVTDDRVPTGERARVAGDTDLRDAPLLGDRRLDTAYVGAHQPARVVWPDLDLQMSLDVPTTWVVFTPEHEIGVEPQTGWPHALGLAQQGVPGTGARTLEPDQSLATTMIWSWRT